MSINMQQTVASGMIPRRSELSIYPVLSVFLSSSMAAVAFSMWVLLDEDGFVIVLMDEANIRRAFPDSELMALHDSSILLRN